MADDRATQPTPTVAFRPPRIFTASMAVIAVGIPAVGFLAAANFAPDFAEPLFRKFFTGYIAMVTLLMIGGSVLWRIYLRRKGIPPIRFEADGLDVPIGVSSNRSVRLAYDQILAAAAMDTLRGPALVLDARSRPYLYPAAAFAAPDAIATFQTELRDRVLARDDGTARWAAMAARAEIAQRFAAHRPWATWCILPIMAAVYVAQLLAIPTNDPLGIIDFGANVAALVGDGQWFRLIPSNLLHVNTLHVVTNTALLWVFGSLVERQIGTLRFVILALASGIAAQAVSAIVTLLQYDGTPSVGASGVLFAMLGAQAVLDHRFRRQMPGFYRAAPTLWWIVVILNFVILPQIAHAPDNAAHAGGLAMGALLGWAFTRKQPNIADHGPSTPTGRIALGTLSGLWLLALAGTAVHGMSGAARIADRAVLARYVLDHGALDPVTDEALARTIALAPSAEPKTLQIALALAERAAARQRGFRRRISRGSELTDTRALINYRLGRLEAAIDLHTALLRQRDTRFIDHFAQALHAYHQQQGVWVVGSDAIQARAITVSNRGGDGLALSVGAGTLLPAGARIYALAYSGTQVRGLLIIDVAPRNESGTRIPQTGSLAPVMGELTDGQHIDVVVFDGRDCRCLGDGVGYTRLRQDPVISDDFRYISIR